MSNIDKRALREAANAANAASWGNWEPYKPHKGARGYEVKVGVKAVAQHCLKVDSVFIAAANPATVLALLDELEAAEKRIAELERKEQHSERQSVIDALASSGEEWSDIEEYMQKWDAERAAAAGKGERA
ncbi:TPA: ead/Ea22-like family protein [Enterobacter chengduensis]